MSAILPSHSYRRRFVFAGVALVVGLLSCVGGDSVGTGGAAALGIVPSFQIGPSDFDSAPIDQIRTNAYDGTSLESVGSTDDNVDPDAAEWSIAIGIDLGGESSREVLLDIELLSENVVQWSGRAGPIIAILGGVPDVLQVPVYRGPLDNLEVEDVTIVGAPTQLLAGASGTATATVQLPPGSSANPEVFWVSLDPTIATVVESGGVATITGVAAGTVTIGAAAGPAFDEVSVEVLPRVSVVDVAPDLTTTDVIDLDVQYTATVLDGFGDPAPGEPVTWSSTDPGVATVDQTGLATTVGFGTTEIQATAGGVTGSGTLTVNGPDLLIADLTVTPDGQGTIVDLAEVQFDADIENAGPSLAAASTLGIRVLDAATGQEAHPTLEYSIPPVNAGEFFSFSDFGGGQVQTGTLPTQLRFEFVADFLGAVAEQDESNNTQVSGDFDVGPTGPTTATWTGAVDTDWATAGNWSGGQVPQAGEAVVIPLTGNQPVLNVTAVVGDLTIDPNATLTITDVVFLGVLGDISIGSGGALAAEIPGGSSVVQVTGPSSIHGLIEPSITMTGAVTLSAPVTTSGSVIVSGAGASLDLADQQLQVDGSFVTGDGGVLIMNGAQSATLNVANGIVFSGGSTEGLLTAGIIRANADFTVAGGSPTAFAPTGLHSVVFQGGATRSVFFDTPSPVGGRFNIVWFDVANTVQLDTDVIVTNEMQVFLGTVTSTGVLSISGRLIDPTGGLSVTSLRFIGDVSAVPGTVPGPLFIDGSVTWPESATVAGDITIGGTLDVGDFGLTINGDIFVNGSLTVPALGTMSATGALELGAGSLLDVDGAITATDGCIDNGATISGTGSTPPCVPPLFSKVWVGGDAAGPTDTENPNNWSPVGVPVPTDDVLVPVTANDPVLTDVGVLASATVDPGATVDLNGFPLTVNGDLDAGGAIVNGLVVIAGAGSVLQGDVDEMRIDATRTLSGPVTTSGDLTLNNSRLLIDANQLNVAGSVLVTGSSGLLTMADPASVVNVAGNATFGGGNHINQLTDGTLRVGGDFSATASSNGSFLAQGSHTTVFDGGGPQTVSFSTPGTALQRFRNVRFEGGGAVTAASDMVTTGTLEVVTGTTVGASIVSISGAFVDPVEGMTLQQLNVTGDLTAIPATLTTDMEVLAQFNLPNAVALNGSVTLNNSRLLIGTNQLDITGDLTVTGGSGLLTMVSPASIVNVAGNATFGGANHINQLTDGTLRVGGDFSATASSNGSFLAQGSHTTVFDGGGPQTVSFSTPGTALQRFRNVRFEGGGAVTAASDMVTTGTLEVVTGTTVGASIVSISGAFVDPVEGMTLQQLNVTGDLTAIPATLTTDMEVLAQFNLPNAVALNGSVTLNNSRLLIGTNQLDITGDLTVTGGSGLLTMVSPASIVNVAGNATFGGGNHINQLTDGTLRVGGDFSATASSNGSFLAQGSHTTVFDGGGPQNVSFSTPGTALQRFRNVRFEGGGAVTAASDMVTTGTLEVVTGTTVGASIVSISGAFVDPVEGMTLQQLNVTGDLTAIPATLTTDMEVLAQFNLPNAVALNGSVTLNNSRLLIGTNQLDITGDLTVTGGSGLLTMVSPASIVNVAGNATFGGGNHINQLTDGTLRVGGDFSATASSNGSFLAQGSHTTVFDGGGPQNVSFSTPGPALQRFRNLAADNVNGSVTFLTDFVVTGDFSTAADATVDASDDVVSVGGSYSVGGGTSVMEINVIGDLTAINTVVLSDVTVNAQFNLPNPLTIQGDLTLNNNRLLVGANTLTVTQNLLVTGSSALLTMADPASVVNVTLNATFDGGNHINQLTEGTLTIGGTFEATASSNGSFHAQTNHTTVFDGTDAQTILFANPGTAAQRFRHLQLNNTSLGVTFLSDVVATGDFSVPAGGVVDASDDALSVGLSFVDGSDGVFLQDLIVVGDLTATSASVNANVTVNSQWAMTNDFTVSGDVTVNNARLLVGPNRLFITAGDLSVTGGSGLLTMTDPASQVDVLGSVSFAGANHINQLTEGELQVAGDFSASGSTGAFIAQTNHTVNFIGAAARTVTFSAPGSTTQRFNNLTLTFPADVSLVTSAVVMGTFDVDDVQTTVRRPALSTSSLDVRGTMNVFEMTVVGVPIRLQTTVPGLSHLFDNVEFVNGSFGPTDVQLYLELPGLGPNNPLNMSGMQFDTSPTFTTGAHLQTERGSGVDIFTTELFSASPSGGVATIIEGANTNVIWPS